VPPILWAIWSGSTHLVELILRQNVPLDSDPSPLENAIQYGYDEMVEMLLDHGASPECADCSRWPGVRTGVWWDRVPGGGAAPAETPVSVPLYTALRGGTDAAVGLLLDAGADPNSTLTMWSGMQWPARSGDLERVRLLMNRGGDPEGDCARRSLRLATRTSQRSTVELLVTHGVDIEAATDPALDEEKVGSTANPATRAHLEELRGILHGPKREGSRVLRLRAKLIDAVIDGDATALLAVEKQMPELLERELVTDDLLHHAAFAGHREVVDVLLEQGGSLPIQAAVALGGLDLVTSMLDADPTLVDDDPPPLKVAAARNHRAMAELLLDRGAELDRVSSNYQPTALFVAVRRRSLDVLELLLERGADVTIRETGDHHHTPLGSNWPLTYPEGEKVRDLLIQYGANPEEQHAFDA
jgi:ankyrin repeat protein